MKSAYIKYAGIAAAVSMSLAMVSCDDYLDITPPSKVSPELYFATADQLGAYTINYYKGSDSQGGRWQNAFPHHGIGGSSYETFLDGDKGTDNEDGTDNRFFDGASKHTVGDKDGSWSFRTINNINYFLETVVPKYEAGLINGPETQIRHYIGEGYMLRATEYFAKLRALGDFPILRNTLSLIKDTLIVKSKRMPRTEVAKFIISDLDSAIMLLGDGTGTGGRNRITKDAARLFKARVALYEATFEKYFAGTPFVPDKNAGWPGAQKEYNANYSYDNAAAVDFFLDEAMKEAKIVADSHPTLTANNKKMVGTKAGTDGFPANPYYDLFCSQDVSSRDEALMYRSYDLTIGGGSCLGQYIRGGRGFTQEFQGVFLMDNGLPIYAPGSNYKGDDFVADTKEGRDWRWRLFTKAPNEYVYSDNADMRIGCGKINKMDAEYKAPALVTGGVDFTTSTGYHKGKGWSPISDYSRGGHDLSAAIIFRTAEAYLIYMEACWEKNGDALDNDAWTYWGKLRTRAGLPADAHITIAATDLDKEEECSHDFGLYSAGSRITSKVLYNIRRERRCELMGEGMRMDDLIRWRALDQLKTTRYYKHGCKIYGPMKEWFTNISRRNPEWKYMKYDQADPNKNNVSSPNDTEGGFNGDARYLSLLRVSSASDWYESGYSWRMAHYLDPIAEDHFVQTATDGDLSTSPIYQNPYWGMIHSTAAQQ